jgi:hypothetical protein
MVLWLLLGLVNLLLLPFISAGHIANYAYIPGDFVGWTIIPLIFFAFSSLNSRDRDQLLLSFMKFMRILLIIGVFKFIFLKLLGIRVIPMGFPIYYLYLVLLYANIIGFRKNELSYYLSKWEKKYGLMIFLLSIVLMVIYAQRTQLIVITFIVFSMPMLYGKFGIKKIALLVLFPMLFLAFLPFLPETILFKFQKLMTGEGTLLPNGMLIPYIVLDNSLTQRLYEAIDAISDLFHGGVANVIFGYGNGASFTSVLMQKFKDDTFIHQIHISYVTVFFRVGLVGLFLLLLVLFYSMRDALKRDIRSLISVAIICVAVDILFFQKIYYSFELPLYLGLLVAIGFNYDFKKNKVLTS